MGKQESCTDISWFQWWTTVKVRWDNHAKSRKFHINGSTNLCTILYIMRFCFLKRKKVQLKGSHY